MILACATAATGIFHMMWHDNELLYSVIVGFYCAVDCLNGISDLASHCFYRSIF